MNECHRTVRPAGLILTSLLPLFTAPGSAAADLGGLRITGSPSVLAEVSDIINAQHGATLHVANNGVDSASCGGRQRPCRSISKAIENANEGDLVLVGPGRYGDLNGDGGFQAGDEVFGVPLSKRLTIASVAGAETTIVEAFGVNDGNVGISADGAVFGLPGRGFTLTGGALGVSIEAQRDAAVIGNISRGNRIGFLAQLGFDHRIVDNAAIDNSEKGFQIRGVGVRVIENVAVSNNVGISVENIDSFVSRNVATSNETDFDITGFRHVLQRAAAIGNRGYGMRVFDDQFGTGLGQIRIRQSNIYGNNTVPRNGNLNCGVANESGQAINASNNFWGAASGPGADPADRACDLEGGRIVVTPFATSEFEVQPLP